MTAKIAIVIPFFQKEKGILRKAVLSALRQAGNHDYEIIIVDDGSPINALTELEDLSIQYPSQIRILTQENAGPAAARNKALNSIGSDTEYVAFLDSDDQWTENHLQMAMCALEQNKFDFYFSDHYQLGQTVSAFNRAGRININEHPKVPGCEGLHVYSGDMFNQILTGNIIGTSTVVYRHNKFPGVRFMEGLVYAGEDYLFWLELATLTSKIAFSSSCECRYGKGVNVFTGSGWGTDTSLIRLHHEMKYKRITKNKFHLNPQQKKHLRREITDLRFAFVRDVLHRVTHRKRTEKAIVLNQLRIDPVMVVLFLPISVAVVFLWVKEKISRK
jgi:succinoglycan biosynthesis protein ExoW